MCPITCALARLRPGWPEWHPQSVCGSRLGQHYRMACQKYRPILTLTRHGELKSSIGDFEKLL